MSVAPREVVWMSAAVSLFLLGGCGGSKSDAGTPADSTTSAAAPAPAPAASDTTTTDTAKKNTSSSTKKDSSTSMKSDSAAPKAAAAKPAKPSATASASQPAAPAKSDSAAAPTQTASADAPLRDAYHKAPRDTVSQEVYEGWKQFNLNCARCHGEDVTGTEIAPHLIVSLKPNGPINTKEIFVKTVCAGRPGTQMPSWCAAGMEMGTIEKIYSYVKARSDAKMAPGRPAVKTQG